jgi:hypothetical protein
MRMRFLLLFCCVLCAGGAQAADKREALVDKVLDPAVIQKMSSTYMTEYAKEFTRTWKTTLQPMDAETEATLLAEFTRRLTTDDLGLLPKTKEIYLKLFTEEELQAMADFYTSPIGRSIAAKTEVFDRELAKIYYPGINDKAIAHWNNTVNALRAAGNKL